jgi:Ca2+-binding EF-hand superfamily protein
MNKKTISLFVAAGALAAASAYAGDKKDGKDWDAKMDAHFTEIDANGDGNISGDEFLAYKRSEAEKHWAKMAEGAGDDGMVSREEMKAMHKAKMEEMKEKKMDHSEH